MPQWQTHLLDSVGLSAVTVDVVEATGLNLLVGVSTNRRKPVHSTYAVNERAGKARQDLVALGVLNDLAVGSLVLLVELLVSIDIRLRYSPWQPRKQQRHRGARG